MPCECVLVKASAEKNFSGFCVICVSLTLHTIDVQFEVSQTY